MDRNDLERPSFLKSYHAALGKSIEIRGVRAVIPYWVLTCLLVGLVAASRMPVTFWGHEHEDVAVGVYVGMLTLDGLVLALSWSAFARIHDCIGDGEFCAYLYKNGVLNDYIVVIDYIHYAQLVSIIASAAGLLTWLYGPTDPAYNRIAFAVMVATSIYAIKSASGAVSAMHDLIWQKSIFETHMRQEREGNIVPFGRNGGQA